MSQISVVVNLPDGRAVGQDEEGNPYIGTPVAVAPDQLSVWTIPTTVDGEDAFHRITHRGDTIVGWGTSTRKAFVSSIRQTVADSLGGEDADPSAVDAELERRWRAEVDTEAHVSQPEFTYRVFEWTEV